jgi:hypothetical protein
MMRRLIFGLGVVLGLLLGNAQAGTVVTSDSGTIGGVQFDNVGVNGSTAMIVISRVPNLFSFVNTVNGATIAPVPANIDGPVTLLVTPTIAEHYALSLVPATYVQEVGNVPGAEAKMAFSISAGVAPNSLPNFFNMSGIITSLLENDNPTLDFSKFATGGDINFTFTGATFSTGITSFAELFATPGSEIVANGSFSQAVPEPASGVLLGLGFMGICLAVLVRGSRGIVAG